jgi:hypothetical protein
MSRTRAYYRRQLASGKTKREALRCLKRMLARHFHTQLRAIETPQPAKTAP